MRRDTLLTSLSGLDSSSRRSARLPSAIVHTAPAASISSHVASRTSPDLAAVSTRNSNASLTARYVDFESRTVSIAAATSL